MRLLEYIMNEGINDRGIFKAVFMAGTPGSGKSYVIGKIKAGQIEPRIVNTDKFFTIFDNNDWNNHWDKIADRVKTVNKDQLALYINSMLPLAVDGTSSSTSRIMRRKGILESFGYETAMVFVNTSLETALERASKRTRQVDPDFIRETYERMQHVKKFYKGLFNIFHEVNNDKGELTEKVIIDSFKKMKKFYDAPLKNPVGKRYMQEMIENGWKYLDPHLVELNYINKVLSIWYNA